MCCLTSDLARGELSPFLDVPDGNRYNYSRDSIERLYRASLPLKSYPREIVLLYLFDSIINSLKKTSKTWLTLEKIYRYYPYFVALNKKLLEYGWTPSKYFSELFWISDIGKLESTFNRSLKINIPNPSEFIKVFDIVKSFKQGYVKDIFINSPIIEGWQKVYYNRYFNIDDRYNYELNLLKTRAISENDKTIYLNSKNIDNKFEVVYNIYLNSDSCRLKGNWLYWSGEEEYNMDNYSYGKEEVKLLGTILGYR